jgi:hypothetical protein
MYTPNSQAVPGVYGVYNSQPRQVFYSNAQAAQYLSPPVSIDGTLSSNTANTIYPWLLWAGQIFGRETSTGKYRPSVIGNATATIASTDTSVTTDTYTAQEIARLIGLAGANVNLTLWGNANGTATTANVTASAASGTTITLSGAVGTAFTSSGTLIQPRDGSQTVRYILGDDEGVAVVDQFLNRVDAVSRKFVVGGGTINTDLLVGYNNADSVVKTAVKAQLIKFAPSLTFLDDQAL